MLLEFYGKECPHCVRMAPLVERLNAEEKIKIEQYEIWHNTENAKKMEEFDKDESGRVSGGNTACGGVPFFFNTETKKFICGEDSYENLKSWALGK